MLCSLINAILGSLGTPRLLLLFRPDQSWTLEGDRRGQGSFLKGLEVDERRLGLSIQKAQNCPKALDYMVLGTKSLQV